MLKISNLSVVVQEQTVLRHVDLTIEESSLHCIIGSNGSGKSTLLHAIMGHPACAISGGSLLFKDIEIGTDPVEKRARLGIFLAFQNPLAMPGVKISTFLSTSYSILTGQPISPELFEQKLVSALQDVGLPTTFKDRYLHEGFSGGERKRLEVAQLLLLPIELALLDEPDSGLDLEGIRSLVACIEKVRQERPSLAIIVVTHSSALISELKPTCVYRMHAGVLQHD